MKNYFFTTFFTLLALLLIIACADVRITHSWQSSSASQNRYNKILVVGLFTNKDRALREQMETHLQGDLQALGIHAVSAIKLYGPTSFEQTNEDAFLSKIEGDGMDAALTIVLLDRKRKNIMYLEEYIFRHFIVTTPELVHIGVSCTIEYIAQGITNPLQGTFGKAISMT